MDSFLSLLGLGETSNNVSQKKSDFETKMSSFNSRVNKVVSDLLIPYLEPSRSKEHQYADLLNLVNVDKCNDYAVFLSKQLGKEFTKLELQKYEDKIYARKIASGNSVSNTSNNNTNSNISGRNNSYSKKELCESIAIHYIKIMNLIASILTAVNPVNSVCLNKMRKLYTTISREEHTGVVQVCKVDPTDYLPLSQQYGIKQFLNLYYFHMVEEAETPQESARVSNEYRNLVKQLNSMNLLEEADISSENNENTTVEEPVNTTEEEPVNTTEEQVSNEQQAIQEQYNQDLKRNEIAEERHQEIKSMFDKYNDKSSEQSNRIENIEEKVSILTQLIESLKETIGTPAEETANTTEEPANTTEETATTAEEPATNTTEEPSTNITEEPSTNITEEPSTNTTEEPSTNTTEEPSANITEEPSTTAEETATTTEEPSTNTTEEPSTTAEEPSTNTTEETATTTSSNINDELIRIINNVSNEPPKAPSDIVETNTTAENTTASNTTASNTTTNQSGGDEEFNVINKFLEFIQQKIEKDDVDPNIIEIARMKLRDISMEELSRVCEQSDEDGNIKINYKDEKMVDFLTKYRELRDSYLKNSQKLFNLLENDILTKTSKDEFTVKSLSYTELANLESDVREILKTMYVDCHTKYHEGIKELEKALV